MDLSNACKLSTDEILKGSFGIEWESLRVHSDGKLSLTPHPEVFGDKLKNPLVTTDFSESQIEIITPTFDSIDEAFDVFSLLADLVNASLPDDEYLWFQSIPNFAEKQEDSNSKIRQGRRKIRKVQDGACAKVRPQKADDFGRSFQLFLF